MEEIPIVKWFIVILIGGLSLLTIILIALVTFKLISPQIPASSTKTSSIPPPTPSPTISDIVHPATTSASLTASSSSKILPSTSISPIQTATRTGIMRSR